MDNLLFARWTMAVSLGFHIVFACMGMVMPVLMALAEWRHRRTGDDIYRRISDSWAKGVAIFFAVGAVSGTVLSFELSLLFPAFMGTFGGAVGLAFAWEGTAFFLEAIFLGMFLYGRRRLSPDAHLFAAVMVAVSGMLSGVMVVSVNGFMNAPAGVSRAADGTMVLDPVAALLNPAWPAEALHMALAAVVATSFAVAGIHAARLWRRPHDRFHQTALRLALPVAAVAALLQPLSGDFSAKDIARRQPEKLAAAEALFETQRPAPLLVGGWPDPDNRTVSLGVHVPYALSVLAFADPDAEVAGLDQVPRADWPPVRVLHVAFQLMVAIGFALAGLALFSLVAWWFKPHWLGDRRVLAVLIAATPLGYLAVEAGWVVTEVGRQPWLVRGLLRTTDAVTAMPHLWVPFVGTVATYALLGVISARLLVAHIRKAEALTDQTPSPGAGEGT